MSVINRRKFLKGVGAAGIAGLAGCSGGNGGGAGRTIKLGILLPQTGDLGQLGGPMTKAGELAVKTVNDADIPFEVDAQVEDTQTKKTVGISAANTLVNAGYPGVVGPASSGINLPVSKQVFIPNQVVGISPSSTALSVTTLNDDDFIYRTAPSDKLQGQVIGQIATEELGVNTASTMYVNNDYGQQLSSAFVTAFEKRGGTVQAEVSFEKKQTSYTSRVQKAVANDPGVLVVIGYPDSGVQLFKDYYADYDPDRPILVTDGMKEATLPKQVGHDMTNVGGSSALASGPAREAFNSAYQEAYGSKPGVYTAHTFDAAAVTMLANAAAGKNAGPAVRDQMRPMANPGGTEVTPENLAGGIEMAASGEEIQYSGASSSVDFDEHGDMRAVTYEYFQFQQGGGIKTIKKISFGQ
ncbi:MAG: ABC transporter substrate-binding protein [Halanaeroarchaeum sp.]